MSNWYKYSIQNVIQNFNSQKKGLLELEIKKRIKKYGLNKLIEKKVKSAFVIFFNQFKELMVLILIIAAIISILLHEYIDGLVIIIIVILNSLLGFWQEFNAEKAMTALKKLAIPKVQVKRNGMIKVVSADKIVPGDIIIIETGNIIPADGRLISASNLKIKESSLTGESEPVEKIIAPLLNNDIPIGDRKNMIYRGSIVVYGRGEAIITETGMQTEIGKIAGLLQKIQEEKTPLQKKLTQLSKVLAFFALGLIVIISIISLFRGEPLKSTFMTGISMAVAAIPEGLPAVVTIALALGAKRMLKKKSLIRHLPAVESLGSVTVICSDKTGTLTQNKMTVTSLAFYDNIISMEKVKDNKNNLISLLLSSGMLCNDAIVSKEKQNSISFIGDPTETALISAARDIGLSKKSLEKSLPRIDEVPFDSNRKRMSTVHEIKNHIPVIEHFISKNDRYIVFTKGAVDGLLNISSRIIINGKIQKMTSQYKKNILKENQKLASSGVRILSIAFKPVKEKDKKEKYEKDIIFIGMVGMVDPIRPEVKESVSICKEAGIRPIMITGDHPLTAIHIAKELRITDNDLYLTGVDLSRMSTKQLRKSVKKISVYARVSPEHKMNLIDALQDNGHIVSMTGDGVNDAPALKSADIGVAMGITGTDVAFESSDMVLLDDNFATIVAAVKEGRTIFDNIKKFIKYILSGNIAEIMVMLLGPFLGLPIPLLPIQILWINLVTDGAPAIAMGYEKAEKDIMSRPPNNPKQGILSGEIGKQIISLGSFTSLICLFVGFIFFKKGSPAWQTMIFTTLSFCQMQMVFSIRSFKKSIFTINPFSNMPLLIAILSTFLLQLCIIYIPVFQKIFKIKALSMHELLICFLSSCLITLAIELNKKWGRFCEEKVQRGCLKNTGG